MPEPRRIIYERPERLGLNLFDVSRIDPTLRDLIFRDIQGNHRLDLRRDATIRLDDKRLEETCVPFVCPLLEAAAVCDAIRSQDRETGDKPTRVYLHKDGTWERLPGAALLTMPANGKVMLNPAVFPLAGVVVELPQAKRVKMGV